MRRFTHRPTVVLALGATLVGLGLGGCTTPTAPVVVPASPSATPVFASDEEALAAAKNAYAKYLEVSDQITGDGGAKPERIKALVTKDQLSKELDGFGYYVTNQIHTSGNTTFDGETLQQYHQGNGIAEVVMYVCTDVTAVRILDAGGTDVTPQRDDRTAAQVTLTGSAKALLIADSALWDGPNTC